MALPASRAVVTAAREERVRSVGQRPHPLDPAERGGPQQPLGGRARIGDHPQDEGDPEQGHAQPRG